MTHWLLLYLLLLLDLKYAELNCRGTFAPLFTWPTTFFLPYLEGSLPAVLKSLLECLYVLCHQAHPKSSPASSHSITSLCSAQHLHAYHHLKHCIFFHWKWLWESWQRGLDFAPCWAPQLDGHSGHNSYWVMCIMWMRTCLPFFLRSPELRGKTKRCKDREHVSPCGYHQFPRYLPLNIWTLDQHLSGSTTLISKFLSSYLLPCFLSRVSQLQEAFFLVQLP